VTSPRCSSSWKTAEWCSATSIRPASELAGLLRTRALSPVEVTQAQLRRIGALDGELASFCHLSAEPALEAARRAEREIVQGRHRGPLHGVPLAVKDVFFTEAAPTAAGMPVHRDFRSGRDATAVGRLRQTGAVLLGKLQMTEGAYADHHPRRHPAAEPVGPRTVARHLIQRPRRGDRRRTVRRGAGL
jgi:amidase